MSIPLIEWPYPFTLERLALALAIGLFVGLERERRRKATGVRTFAFVTLLGCLGGLLGEAYALLIILSISVLIVFLNLQTLRADRGTELTTSAALLIMGVAGVLCGQGHRVTPVAVAVVAAALLAWKKPLKGFSLTLSDTELRSAILLAILAFVIYPALPTGPIDPWQVLIPRDAFLTVILIAGIGFINYILWKIYGTRGIELTGFLGGLVNSTVTVSELAARVHDTDGQLADVAYRGSLLATAAMVVRNMAILAILAPSALVSGVLGHLGMLLACGGLIVLQRKPAETTGETPLLHLESPFSLQSALKYGCIFLLLQVVVVLAQRALGQVGVYVTSMLGGIVSSASSVAAVAALSSQGSISSNTASIGAIIASFTSAAINLPLIMRAKQKSLTWRIAWSLGVILIVGIAGCLIQFYTISYPQFGL